VPLTDRRADGNRPIVPAELSQEATLRGHELHEDGTFEREGRVGYRWTCVLTPNDAACPGQLLFWHDRWYGAVLRRACGATARRRGEETAP
jgi:hypothetical protein